MPGEHMSAVATSRLFKKLNLAAHQEIVVLNAPNDRCRLRMANLSRLEMFDVDILPRLHARAAWPHRCVHDL
jgi:hypothetical protein